MEQKIKEVVIDIYALMAIVYDEVGRNAIKIFKGIRSGNIEGLIPTTAAYEYIVHWLRGRIPGLKNIDEVITYLKNYFTIVELSFNDFVEAAKIKVEGDKMLKMAEREDLRNRKLSIVDSTVLALALKRNIPIITGDTDLAYVAKLFNINVIW